MTAKTVWLHDTFNFLLNCTDLDFEVLPGFITMLYLYFMGVLFWLKPFYCKMLRNIWTFRKLKRGENHQKSQALPKNHCQYFYICTAQYHSYTWLSKFKIVKIE